MLRAVGVAVFAGTMIGDGVSALLRVLATTGWAWWTLSIVIGAATLAWVVVRRLDRWRERLVAAGLTVVAAGAFVGLFSLL